MIEDTNNFDEYISWVKQLPLLNKKNILYDQLRDIAEAAKTLQSAVHIENSILDKVDDIKENFTEDEYIENLIVLASSIQNSISDFAVGTSNIIQDLMEENKN